MSENNNNNLPRKNAQGTRPMRAVPVRRKQSKAKTIVAVCLISILVLIVAVAAILLLYKPTFGEHPSVTDSSGLVITDEYGNNVERDQGKFNVLILGKDRWAFNTDVMMIVSYDIDEGAATFMQIPRDTYIDVGRGNLKANSLLASFYSEAVRDGAEDPYATAVKGFENTIEQVFCITIDYYAIMDLNGFVNIVDALGGVKMNVPARMYYNDPIQNLKIDLYPGEQVLTGDQAEQFVRFRKGYVEGDIGRVDAQKLFLSACMQTVKENFTVSTVSRVVEQAIEYIKTDMSLKDMVYIAKQALSVDLSKTTMLTLPGIQGRQYDNEGIWYYIVYRDAAISAINKYYNSYSYEITADMFDKDDALYDNDGTYMHSIYLTENAEEESYSADSVEDIEIYRYSSYSSSSSTTKATTVASDPVTEPVGDTTETSEPVVTDVTDISISDEMTATEEEPIEPQDTTAETTEIVIEPSEQ